jgi:DNA-binding MarR family transcriptional regulator
MSTVPESDASSAPIALGRRFYQIARARLAEVQEPLGLLPLEFGVLVRLRATPGVDQNSLAEQMALDRTTTGALVQRLEELGYLTRTVNAADRRARILRLSRAGQRFHDAHRPAADAAQAAMLAALSVAERRTLLDLMRRVVDANPDYVRPGPGRRLPPKPQPRQRER